MIQGKKINLRLIKEEDISEINKLGNNLTDRGKYHDFQFFSILREECPLLNELIKEL